MPLGTQTLSANSIVHVGATAAPVTPVGGLLSWDVVGDSPTARRDYIGQASASAAGKSADSLTIPVDYEQGDSGQKVLGDAYVSKATIYAKVLPDGTNGATWPVKVSHREIHAPDANGFNSASFTLDQQGDPVPVGTGLFGAAV